MTVIDHLSLSPELAGIAGKIREKERISVEEAIELYRSSHLAFLGILGSQVKRRLSGDYVFFNRNFHIEPSNLCVNSCRFCSFRRHRGQPGAWEYTIEEMTEMVRANAQHGATEVHIVGGVHPDRDLFFYVELLKSVKQVASGLQIKAFTAVEVDYMCKKAGISCEDGLKLLIEAGLTSMPGGGAEIFDEQLREEIAPGKTSSTDWLRIHETAHHLGLATNATMLYGLKETYEHRVDHLERLRDLQDRTGGFNAFIPLKFRRANNDYALMRESSVVEDLKNYAVSRIFLDNIPHLKAYWPMIGKKETQLSLFFGVDDLDGTIDDSTRIYSMAGAEEQNPCITIGELSVMIDSAGFIPAERDTLYNIIRTL